MKSLKKLITNVLFFYFISFLIFLTCVENLFAQEINWIEVANSIDAIQFIDTNSIKYNNKGFLSVMTKHSEVNTNDRNIINTETYLLAIDCDNRLFSKLPVNAGLNQVKNWTNPTNDKLIKTTIINSCFY